jgi:hypothetical protein
MKKPFDTLAEGPVSEKRRDNNTPLKLFLAGTRALASDSPIIRALAVELGS